MVTTRYNTSISQRLAIGFTVIIFILLSSILITLWQINKLDATISNLASRQMPITEASMNLLSSINDASATLRGFLLTRDTNFAQENEAIWQTEIIPTILKLQANANTWMNKEDRVYINNIATKVQDIQVISSDIRGTLDNIQAVKLFASALAPKVTTLKLEVKTLTNTQNMMVDKHIENTKKEIYQFVMFEWLILGIGLLVSGILSFRISKSLVDPIKNVVNLMDDIAEGRSIKAQKLHGPKEIQQLGDSATHLVNTLNELTQTITRVADQHYDVSMQPRCDEDKMILALISMANTLKDNAAYYADQIWLQKGINTLADSIAKSGDLKQVCSNALNDICRHLDAGVGALYLNDTENQQLGLTATFSFVERDGLSSQYHYGEGVVGQVAMEGKPILLKNISRRDVVIQSGVTEEPPLVTYTFPLLDKTELIAVIELGFHDVIETIKTDYIQQISPTLASSIRILDQKQLTEALLTKQRALTEELTTQQEELKTSNEELETQAEELRTSEEELRVRDEEQRTLNQTLEEKNQNLEQQKIELEKARADVMRRAEELSAASKYKSEFLANMSHELRTPLNSILLLSKLLSDEKQTRLDPEDRESVEVIHKSAEELLHLINDVLDLSKVEAGKIKLETKKIKLNHFFDEIKRDFKHVAQEKNLAFDIDVAENAPQLIVSDEQRLKQIVKNLLSNAFKFTEHGGVTVKIRRPSTDAVLTSCQTSPTETLALEVHDTGIGIPKDKQKDIFKTFYQCDGATNRNYAGTGLGLSISLQLASLLGGEIQVDSTPGEGSTFMLYIPETLPHALDEKIIESKAPSVNTLLEQIRDVGKDVSPATPDEPERTLLIVEDDPQFAQILKTTCEKKGFKCTWAKDGAEALQIANQQSLLGILMDMNLPDQSGLTVVDKLKNNEKTKNIPVHFISGADKQEEAMQHGAISFIMKPVTIEQLDSTIKEIEKMVSGKLMNLLIIEDDKTLRDSLKKIFKGKQMNVISTGSGKKAVKLLKKHQVDCIILDLHLSDISGFDVLEQLQSSHITIPPVIVYTGKDLTEGETQLLEKYSHNIIIKGKASLDRLMDETLLFIHHLGKQNKRSEVSSMDVSKVEDKQLIGKKILLVDDDVRNTFSLAKSLKVYGAEILIAPNGQVAIEILTKEHDIALVLMDIMMPVMDGYEAIKRIRAEKQFASLPIIALTAKAMSQDREEALTIGATDYMAKPVDMNKLLILMRAWV